MDKAFWQDLVANNYELEDQDRLVPLTKELIEYLASPDPELRDTFAYGVLARWIIHYRYHTADDLAELYPIFVANMKYQLGAQGDDTVFLRSYSALALSLVMYRDSREGFLDEIELQAILDDAMDYLLREQDLRAYVPAKGWANAIGNASDLLRFIAHNQTLAPADLQRTLHTIADRLLMPTDDPFAHDEEDRLAKVATVIMLRDALTAYDLIEWTRRFIEWRQNDHITHRYDRESNSIYQNIKRFLWAIHAQIETARRIPFSVEEFQPELLDTIDEFSL